MASAQDFMATEPIDGISVHDQRVQPACNGYHQNTSAMRVGLERTHAVVTQVEYDDPYVHCTHSYRGGQHIDVADEQGT